MLFNSLAFLIFFPIVTLLFFLLPHRIRWAHLLLASCVFYAFSSRSISSSWPSPSGWTTSPASLIEGAAGRRRKLFLLASIVANVGVLSVFKYWNFLNHNLADRRSVSLAPTTRSRCCHWRCRSGSPFTPSRP